MVTVVLHMLLAILVISYLVPIGIVGTHAWQNPTQSISHVWCHPMNKSWVCGSMGVMGVAALLYEGLRARRTREWVSFLWMVGVVAGIAELLCFPVTHLWHYGGAFLACGSILGWMAWQAWLVSRIGIWIQVVLQAGLLAGLARELSRGGKGDMLVWEALYLANFAVAFLWRHEFRRYTSSTIFF
jgi:hypothetical protein